MYRKSCAKIHKSIYGIKAQTQLKGGIGCSTGTGFMIASNILVTAAHLTHRENDFNQPMHSNFEVICSTNIGKQMEKARLIASDSVKDIALLKIDNPKSRKTVTLLNKIMTAGTNCGLLGFPLGSVSFNPNGNSTFILSKRFQGAYVSNLNTYTFFDRNVLLYELDALIYSGASGCPVFLLNGKVIGMEIRTLVDKPKNKQNNSLENKQHERLAIALAIPSIDIIQFAKKNNIL
jgi:S1-C subfamily serine protease